MSAKVKLKVINDYSVRPDTRGDCENMARPCPYVSCRHHLLLDVTETGSIKAGKRMPALILNGRASEIRAEYMYESWADGVTDELMGMRETCSLDVAEDGSKTLAEVGELFGMTRERVRQIEAQALSKLRSKGLARWHLQDFVPDEFAIKERIEKERRLHRERAVESELKRVTSIARKALD